MPLVTARVGRRILTLRDQRVILDSDLAELYGVETRRLNEQVRRNAERFPEDFMFQLSEDEWSTLRSQIATSNRGGRRKRPYAFTEHGAIQAANVLNSAQAIEMGVYVVRAFVHLRAPALSHEDLARRLDELERRIGHKLTVHDEAIAGLIEAIRNLMQPPAGSGRPIGFVHDPE